MRLVLRCALLVPVLAVLAGLMPGSAAAAKPTAAVALGDSAMSGESAGNYEPGTDQPGNYCHRSRNALIHMTTIPGISARINLACSGASSKNIVIGGSPQNGLPPQSEQLRVAARTYDIKLVIVEVGTNDDPQYGDVARGCVTLFVLQAGPCRLLLGPDWLRRLGAMQPKVRSALQDVRTVMRQEGYADSSYQLIDASYWSPVPSPPIRAFGYLGKLAQGCPMYDTDMAWGHNIAVPLLSLALRSVAAGVGARFLDLSQSMSGHEVCAAGISQSQEWTNGVIYDPTSSCPQCSQAFNQSLHANARGHAQLGRCVTEFYAQPGREGACRPGSDGNLHATVLR